MFKKGVILVILFSMMLHCAGRLGVLSYLYQQRHEIAYSIGLITELPIAVCSSEYNFDSGLNIRATDESDHSLPPGIFQAREIQLFCNERKIEINPALSVIRVNKLPEFLERAYCSPSFSVFHPPSLHS